MHGCMPLILVNGTEYGSRSFTLLGTLLRALTETKHSEIPLHVEAKYSQILLNATIGY